MRVLLDNNVLQQLAPLITGHEVVHARQLGWSELANGNLIGAAEAAGFEVLITADRGILYQQNIAGRKISILLLRNYRITMKHLKPLIPNVLTALEDFLP
jgi:predicted nuclease of predicted toxin-antitoxin system